jgi:hypothetical protein
MTEVRLGLVIPLATCLLLVPMVRVASSDASSLRERFVPCSESIDGTRFPYIGSSRPEDRYRLVLGYVSVPPAYLSIRSSGRTAPPWSRFYKAGLVIRASGRSVIVEVPAAWRGRAAIAWGYGGKGVFDRLRFAGCKALPTQGFAYSGGFYVRSSRLCLPLVFRVGRRAATVRFGLGRGCR